MLPASNELEIVSAIGATRLLSEVARLIDEIASPATLSPVFAVARDLG
jgi:hypothetical protein